MPYHITDFYKMNGLTFSLLLRSQLRILANPELAICDESEEIYGFTFGSNAITLCKIDDLHHLLKLFDLGDGEAVENL